MSLSDLPLTAEEARRLGLKHYYSGRPCKWGHASPRYSHAARGCVECTLIKSRANVEANRSARGALPPVRPLVLLGADWSPRVVDGTWVDVQRLALKEQNSRESA